MRLRLGLRVAASGLVLAAVAILTTVLVVNARTSRTPAAAPLPSGPSQSASTADGPAGSTSGPSATPPSPADQSGLAGDSVRIPSLGVTAKIVEASVINGVLTPPRVPTEVGRWAGSAPLDATSGEVTIAGHVNWAGLAPFAFGRLARVVPGALIYTTDADAHQSVWRVSAVRSRPKSQPIDSAAFAGTKGARRLVLITCGGAFDSADLSYKNNVYVYASPVKQ